MRFYVVPVAALAVTGGLVFSGCASGVSGSGAGDEVDSETYAVSSAVETMNSAIADAEQSPTVAIGRPVETKTPTSYAGIFGAVIPNAFAGSCGADRFDPPLGSESCAGTLEDRTVLSVFDDCEAGPRGAYLSGTITLSFDASATCDDWIDDLPLPTSGYVVRTSSDFTRHNGNGSTVTKVSDEHQNYLDESVSGGVKTVFGINQRQIHILGIHRVRTSPEGRTVFDHSVRTGEDDPLIVTGTRAENNRRVSDGKLRIDHNILGYTLETDLDGLFWTSDCCHPVDGTITFTRSGSKTGTKTVEFGTGTCGQVTVTDDGGTAETVELEACE